MELNTCKIVLIGESNIGKTSIMNRFLKKKFEEIYKPTTTIHYESVLIYKSNNYSIKLVFWDTAGQERFNSLTKMVYKNANIIILTYSIDNKLSFEKIKNFWYNDINDNVEFESKNNLYKKISIRINW